MFLSTAGIFLRSDALPPLNDHRKISSLICAQLSLSTKSGTSPWAAGRVIILERYLFVQVKFSGIFGHQMFAVNYIYERYYDKNLQHKIELQQRFRSSTWDVELDQLAQELGWTHLIIYRPSPHPEYIPLPLLFENEEYQVYAFKNPQKH